MIISETASKINLNSVKISNLLKTLSTEVSEITSIVQNAQTKNIENKIAELRLENEKLEEKVDNYKKELRILRAKNGIPQIPVPNSNDVKLVTSEVKKDISVSCDVKPSQSEIQSKENKKLNKEEQEIHFGRLDIRVGKIINVEKHPNADSLYVEQVDVGDEKLRTILSGLVKYVPIEKMKDRLALFLCNLKPVKMRGINSEGMIMCTSTSDQCEILEPPSDSIPGEIVTVEGFERKPDPQLNPKKKIFEIIQLDLKVNDKKEATYKDIPWNVGGKGPAVSTSLKNTIIK